MGVVVGQRRGAERGEAGDGGSALAGLGSGGVRIDGELRTRYELVPDAANCARIVLVPPDGAS